jgi:eukaryotic-like serine/threonine-protein kinase
LREIEGKNMKPRPHHSSIGTIAAILLSFMPWAGGRAQDLPAQPPLAIATAKAHASELAACSPDGESYALATPDGRIRCGRTRGGAAKRTFHRCHPRAVVFSPDGRFLAVAGAANGCPAGLKVWRVEDGTTICKLAIDAGNDPLISFSPDGRLLVGTGDRCRINLWEFPAGTLKWTFTTDQPITQLALSNEGQAVVVVLADGSVQRFSVR